MAGCNAKSKMILNKPKTQKMKKILITLTFLLAGFFTKAQTTMPLNIDSCYSWAKKQYPLTKQRGLIEKTRDYNVSNAAKGYLPQLSINGQATYQYPVIYIPLDFHLPGLNFAFPTFTNYQYNVHGEVDQSIYEGGVIKQQKESQQAGADIQQQSLEVQLYTLRDRINQIFFGALLINEQLKQNALMQKDLQNNIDNMQAAITNGTALSSSLDELQAELIQQQQNEINLKSSRKAYLDMLALFINKSVDENATLETPPDIAVSATIKRPELALYDYQKKNDDVQMKMINATNRPKFSFFLQGGYALPGLNEFDANPAFYYIGGFRLSWTLGGLYTMHNQKQLLLVDQQSIDAERETFLFNTNLTMLQQNENIANDQQLIGKDNDIVNKREAVTQTSKAQLNGGTITVHDYITELDAEDQAKQSLLLHQVQMLMDEYNYQNTSGN
jgi:outer membrane protein TolC